MYTHRRKNRTETVYKPKLTSRESGVGGFLDNGSQGSEAVGQSKPQKSLQSRMTSGLGKR